MLFTTLLTTLSTVSALAWTPKALKSLNYIENYGSKTKNFVCPYIGRNQVSCNKGTGSFTDIIPVCDSVLGLKIGDSMKALKTSLLNNNLSAHSSYKKLYVDTKKCLKATQNPAWTRYSSESRSIILSLLDLGRYVGCLPATFSITTTFDYPINVIDIADSKLAATCIAPTYSFSSSSSSIIINTNAAL